MEPLGKNLKSSLEAKTRLWPQPPRTLATAAESVRKQSIESIPFDIVKDIDEGKPEQYDARKLVS